MVFAWKIAKHVKTNAVVVAKDFKTLAIVGGQTSRVDAVETALNRAATVQKKQSCMRWFYPCNRQHTGSSTVQNKRNYPDRRRQ